MELNHWYKGTELPDKECDCVVVFWGQGTIKNREKGLGWVCFDSLTKRLRFVCPVFSSRIDPEDRHRIISDKRIIAWMPIEFPKEVK